MKHLRNVAIIAAVAAAVVIIPGGGTGASVVTQTVSVVFLASVAWVASLLYREHRVALYSLGDRRRGVLYAAIGLVTLTLTATSRLWHTVSGRLAWFALIAVVVYAAAAVFVSARRT